MPTDDEQYSPEETARRRDEAIRRALNTAPKTHKEMAAKGKASHPKSSRNKKK